ncbi:hypothetical protein [Mucilaginibacter ginsenosidivorans]|uniref:DUF2306 domain-containing protein n=1 Tax=Mucilaginibacter ginsenosidivorans TaxID=398053 RepID=A0A5B8UZK1_9SPHI|nr:hypothetical protein [Mucilaginibacter ginsenosidivorans]QEC64013.1 hypothetical protein FRZ54_15995 [Mucilaginibacter ginsenosidivorans]
MPNHLSVLGIIHTAISIIALLVAYYALYRSGKLDPATGPGRTYILLTILTCVTGFPIMKTGHLTAGHFTAIIILVLLPIGIYAHRIFGKAAKYVQVIVMSTTLFLSMVPAIVETLTRLPISSPIATGPNDPIIQNGLLILFILYIAGVIYQVIKIKKRGKTTPPQATPSGA